MGEPVSHADELPAAGQVGPFPPSPLTHDAMLREAGPIGGYAFGGYLCRCGICSREFVGAKHAVECLPCAIKALKGAAL